MKSLFFVTKGWAGDVLEFGEMEEPAADAGMLKIQVIASPIHPADIMFIGDCYRVHPVYPQIAGFEGAGIIVDNGGDQRFSPGSLVSFRHRAAWAEYVSVRACKAVPVAPGLSVDKAAQLSLNALTAWALLEAADAKAGEWLVLSAGNSAVSRMVIQFAYRRGIHTIALVRDPGQKTDLMRLGASLVVASAADEVAIGIRKYLGKERIAGFLDAVGGPMASAVFPVMSQGARIIHYGMLSEQPVWYDHAQVIFKNLHIDGFGIDAWLSQQTPGALRDHWEAIINHVLDPAFEMPVSGRYPLREHRTAMAAYKKEQKGKILFSILE